MQLLTGGKKKPKTQHHNREELCTVKRADVQQSREILILMCKIKPWQQNRREQAYLQASRYLPWDPYLPPGAAVRFSFPLKSHLTWILMIWLRNPLVSAVRTQKIIVQKRIPKALGFAFHLVKELSYSSLGAGKLVL